MMLVNADGSLNKLAAISSVLRKYRLLITGVILIVVLSFGIFGIVNARQPDLYVKVVQNTSLDPFNAFNEDEASAKLRHEKLIASLLPDIKCIKYEEQNNYSSSKLQLSMDCFAGQADVFIVEESLYKELVEFHFAMNLDSYAGKLGVSPENDLGLYKKGGRKDGVHLYGINLDDSRTAKAICRNLDHRIAVVFIGSEHEFDSIRFIQALCNN